MFDRIPFRATRWIVVDGYGELAANGFKVPNCWAKTGWQQWQIDLVGTAPDVELAARLGADGHGGSGDAESAGAFACLEPSSPCVSM
jgi:hypothetical protein